jgi:hypothetical protein
MPGFLLGDSPNEPKQKGYFFSIGFEKAVSRTFLRTA